MKKFLFLFVLCMLPVQSNMRNLIKKAISYIVPNYDLLNIIPSGADLKTPYVKCYKTIVGYAYHRHCYFYSLRCSCECDHNLRHNIKCGAQKVYAYITNTTFTNKLIIQEKQYIDEHIQQAEAFIKRAENLMKQERYDLEALLNEASSLSKDLMYNFKAIEMLHTAVSCDIDHTLHFKAFLKKFFIDSDVVIRLCKNRLRIEAIEKTLKDLKQQ